MFESEAENTQGEELEILRSPDPEKEVPPHLLASWIEQAVIGQFVLSGFPNKVSTSIDISSGAPAVKLRLLFSRVPGESFPH